MAEESLKHKTAKGIAWSAVDKFATQGVNFLFNILIARILSPGDYGLVAMIAVFIAICNCFVDSGFTNALIRKPDRTDVDYDTVFYFNIVIAFLAYAVLFISAPFIAAFYNAPELTRITRIISLGIIISSFAGIHGTKLSIEIDFRKKAIASISCALISGSTALLLAHRGFGVYSLVFQSLAASVTYNAMMWILVRWKPRLRFSIKSFKDMFSYGSKLLATSLINTIYSNIYTIVIGKLFSKTSLGLYGKASNLANFPSGGVTSVLQAVTFPVLSQLQSDEDKLKAAYTKFLNLSAFVIFPMMMGMAALADPFIRFLLTDKWAEAIPLLQLLCFSMMWYPIHAINLNILEVKGRSDFFLKLEVIKKIIGIVVLLASFSFGITGICIGGIVVSLVSLPINTFYTKRLIGYGFVAQMKGLSHILILSSVMSICVYLFIGLFDSVTVKLFSGTIAGILIYSLGAFIFKFDEMNELLSLIRRR